MKVYPSGIYTIVASDIDPGMIEIAKANAERAGVGSDITFSVSNFLSPLYKDFESALLAASYTEGGAK